MWLSTFYSLQLKVLTETTNQMVWWNEGLTIGSHLNDAVHQLYFTFCTAKL